MRRRIGLAVLGLALAATGCGPRFGPNAVRGITFYCPGIGNTDFGDAGVRAGLAQAGYRGQVATFNWTLAPIVGVVDQALRINARLKASLLAREIERYQDEYPGRPVNLVGISAGTGVCVWALEDLPANRSVDNVVLLASSLWHKYDVSKALKRVRGRMYCYHSPYDAILSGPMKLFGTIDGVFGEDGAGAVGLRVPPGRADRLVNVRYRPEFQRYGYYGGHVDGTSPSFVRHVLAANLLTPEDDAHPGTNVATARDSAPRGATSD